MRVTEEMVARVPVGNLRVRRAEFSAVWAAAEQRCSEQGARGVTDWYAGAVVTTCRWLAGAIVDAPGGQRVPAPAPVTYRSATASEELIEVECLAAEQLDMRQPGLVTRRPGWVEGIQATMRWAWRRTAPAPVAVDTASAVS